MKDSIDPKLSFNLMVLSDLLEADEKDQSIDHAVWLMLDPTANEVRARALELISDESITARPDSYSDYLDELSELGPYKFCEKYVNAALKRLVFCPVFLREAFRRIDSNLDTQVQLSADTEQRGWQTAKNYHAATAAATRPDKLEYFTNLLEENRRRLCSFASNYVRSAHDAEDIVQAVYSNLLSTERYENLIPDWNPAGFLYRCVINECRTFLRMKARRRSQSLYGDDGSAIFEPVDERRCVEQEVETAEQVETAKQVEIMEQLIGQLSEQQRLVIQKRHMEQKKYAQIAAELNITVSAVGSTLHNARKALLAKANKHPCLKES